MATTATRNAPRNAPPSRRGILVFEGPRRRDYWRRFAMMLSLSVVIATAGLYRDSGAVVIAAMLIAPLMTPILGIAAALVMGWARRAGILLGIVLAAAACSAGMAYLILLVSGAPHGIGVPGELTARTDPGIEELLVALAAGAAGAYVQLNRAEVSLVPGAAIGVSLVPPLAAAGIFLYFGRAGAAADALILFGTNLAAIVVAAAAVYLLAGMRPRWTRHGNAARFGARFGVGFVVAAVAMAAVASHLANETLRRFETARLEERAYREVVAWARGESVEVARLALRERTRNRSGRLELWLIIDVPMALSREVASPSSLVPDHLKGRSLEARLKQVLGEEADVALRVSTRFASLVDLRTMIELEAQGPYSDGGEDAPVAPRSAD